MLIPTLPVYVLIWSLRRKIHHKLRNAILRPEVREKHRQLTFVGPSDSDITYHVYFQALSSQSIVPGIFILSSLAFLICQLRIIESPLLESFIFLLTVLVPVINPFLTVAFICPYREAIMRFVGLDPKEWSISKNSSVAPGDSPSAMFGSFDNSSVTSVSSAFTITETKNPFD